MLVILITVGVSNDTKDPPQDNRDADPSGEPGGMSQVFEDVQVFSPGYRYVRRYPM